jgi:hypothetical protein
MAKPSWITIISGSTGSGSGTRSLKASSHTGRSSRSGSIKGVTSGGASDSVVLSQYGAGEFITVDKAYYFVTALGGTVKITGTSNSPSLKLTNLTNSSLLSNFALNVNGAAYSWDGNASHQISGDPGASSSYTFEISFDVAENQTENSRDITFRLRDSGDPGVSSGTITIRQTEGEKTYGTASGYMRYSNWNIGAEGGVATPFYGFSIPWGWNGKTSGGGTLTQSNSSHSVKYTYFTIPPGSPYNWTLDEQTGEIVMSSLGKNIIDSDKEVYIKITIIVNGQTLTYTDFVRQGFNKVTYTLSSASVSLDDIPASGGSADSPNFISASGKIDYSSGESDTPSITSSDVIITLSKTVNGSNLGSTIKARTKLDTVTATITWNGSQTTKNIDVYQQANQVTYSSVSATSSTVIIPKTGGDVDIAAKVSPNQTATYTSGATRTITDFTYEFTSVPSLVTIDELNLKATVGENVTGLTRDDTIKMKITGEGSKSTTASISYHQESLVRPSWSLGATETCASNISYLSFTVSDPENMGWRVIPQASWINLTSINDNHRIDLEKNLTGSPRTGTVQLVSTDFNTVYATCIITQEASAEEAHILTITHEVCGKLNDASGDITICVSPFGTLNEFNEDHLELGTTDYVNNSDLGLLVAHSVIEQLSTKLNVGDWMDCNYLYFWVKNGSTQANVVPVFGSTSKTHFTNTTFVFYEYDLITTNLKNQLSDFAASGNTDSIDLSETYGVNLLSTRKMTLKGTFPVAFAQDPTGNDMEAFLRLYYHAGSEICYAPAIPIQPFDNINNSTDSDGNIIKNISFYRVIPLTQSTDYITFDGWEIFLINNNSIYNVVAKAHDGHINLTAEPISANMSFGFSVGTGSDIDTEVIGDKWLAPFDEDGDQSYRGWDFGSLDNDCTMDVSAATGKSWIALFS